MKKFINDNRGKFNIAVFKKWVRKYYIISVNYTL